MADTAAPYGPPSRPEREARAGGIGAEPAHRKGKAALPPDVHVTKEEALFYHRMHRGKMGIQPRVPLRDARDLSLAYTPGVAEPCKEIARQMLKVYEYTGKGNSVAIVTDGTAVLGLGDIGPRAALPVMEGKAILFKKFAGLDGYPICLDTRSVDEIVTIVKALQPTFGGINLEDISAPRCFEIEQRLKDLMRIPVFHDDQHGTAIITLAGLYNALALTGRRLEDARIVVNGAGAAGMAIARLIMHCGAADVLLCDTKGILHEGRTEGMNAHKAEVAKVTNKRNRQGRLADALEGADVFVGVSAGGVVTQEMVRRMADRPVIFAQANPDPEILPERAEEAGAAVIATGRSDYPNQINNALGYPGIFRGALDVMATDINVEMKVAAARALAGLVGEKELAADYVIPSLFDPRVVPAVACAVAAAACDTKVARREYDEERILGRITFGR